MGGYYAAENTTGLIVANLGFCFSYFNNWNDNKLHNTRRVVWWEEHKDLLFPKKVKIGGIMLGHKISRKESIKLTNFIDIYCDHRDSCQNKKCLAKPIMKFSLEDVAFSEKRKCKEYRGSDELGSLREATIKEVGIWK